MQKKLLIAGTLVLSIVLMQSSCKKNALLEWAEISTASSDQSNTEMLIDDVEENVTTEVDNVLLYKDGVFNKSCPSISFRHRRVFPDTIVIDWGTSGCIDRNGRVKRGSIQVIITGPMQYPGSKRTTTFNNYSVDSVGLTGTVVVENISPDSVSCRVLRRNVTNAQLTFPDGTFRAWNATHTRTQTQGCQTKTILDDAWSITGGSNGQTRAGNAFTSNITTPILRSASCPRPTTGTVSSSVGSNNWVIDFGNGTCDRTATVSFNGSAPRTFTMRR